MYEEQCCFVFWVKFLKKWVKLLDRFSLQADDVLNLKKSVFDLVILIDLSPNKSVAGRNHLASEGRG